MLDKYELPQNLSTVISEEKIDFSVKAKRAKPVKSSVGLFFFGAIWTAFTSIFVFAFFGPLFFAEERWLFCWYTA
jgi:hypothetical protein